MFDFLGKAEDKLDIAKTSAALLSKAKMFLVVPSKKRIYIWCSKDDIEEIRRILGNEYIETKELRGSMRLVVGTF